MLDAFRQLQATQAGRNTIGIFAMLVAGFGYIVNDAFSKLVSERLPTGEIIFFRGLIATLLISVVLLASGKYRDIGMLRAKALPIRMIGEVVATLLYLTALFNMPIGNSTVILQATPLLVTAGSALFLREHVGWRRWSAITVGFLGVVLIVRPGFAGFDAWALVALASVFFMVMRDLATRLLPAEIPSLLVTGFTSFSVMLLGVAMAPFETWMMPTAIELFFLFCAASFVLIGYFFIILTMRVGDVAVVSPFRYAIVVYAMVLGFLIWGDVPDLLTIIGTLVIVSTGLYTFYRERITARQ